MPKVNIRGYGQIELDKEKTRRINLDEEIKLKDLYKDNELDIDNE